MRDDPKTHVNTCGGVIVELSTVTEAEPVGMDVTVICTGTGVPGELLVISASGKLGHQAICIHLVIKQSCY